MDNDGYNDWQDLIFEGHDQGREASNIYIFIEKLKTWSGYVD